MVQLDSVPVDGGGTTPTPPNPVDPSTPPTGDTMVVGGEIRSYLPVTIPANFNQTCYILAEPMAGGGGASVSRYMSLDGGPAVNGPRWDNLPFGTHSLTFTGGKEGVQYSIKSYAY